MQYGCMLAGLRHLVGQEIQYPTAALLHDLLARGRWHPGICQVGQLDLSRNEANALLHRAVEQKRAAGS